MYHALDYRVSLCATTFFRHPILKSIIVMCIDVIIFHIFPSWTCFFSSAPSLSGRAPWDVYRAGTGSAILLWRAYGMENEIKTTIHLDY